MATGSDHYREAERILTYAETSADLNRGGTEEIALYAEAQVHATLALAAATALNACTGGQGLDLRERNAWYEVAGEVR